MLDEAKVRMLVVVVMVVGNASAKSVRHGAFVIQHVGYVHNLRRR